jgi:hypothetical protein
MAVGITLAAQEPAPANPRPNPPTPSPTAQPPSAQTPAAQAPAAAVTVEGCLVREQDVAGRTPNPAERAGVMEDYILTNTKIVKGTAPAGSAAEPKAGDTPTGTSGSSTMYDVKGLEGSELKPLVGQRVQIDGSFADLTKSPSAKPGQDLADLKGTAIRKVAGDCPAK